MKVHNVVFHSSSVMVDMGNEVATEPSRRFRYFAATESSRRFRYFAATEPSRWFRYFEATEPSIVLTVPNSEATEPS